MKLVAIFIVVVVSFGFHQVNMCAGTFEGEDGVYALERGDENDDISLPGGYPARIGTKLHPSQYFLNIRPLHNSNEKYWITLTRSDIENDTFEMYYAIVIGGVVYAEKGGMHVFGEFSKELAERIAELNSSKLIKRKHPGHKLTFEFVPRTKEFRANDQLLVDIKVTNIGETSLWLSTELQQDRRSVNANMCCAVDGPGGELKRQPSIPMSGQMPPTEVKTGETIVLKVENIRNWFVISMPGRYSFIGTYFVNFYDGDGRDQIIWTEHLASSFHIDILK